MVGLFERSIEGYKDTEHLQENVSKWNRDQTGEK